jgi:hypothetical protein
VPPRTYRRLRIALLALVTLAVAAVLAKLWITGQPWPDSRVLGRGLFVVTVLVIVPIAWTLWRRR